MHVLNAAVLTCSAAAEDVASQCTRQMVMYSVGYVPVALQGGHTSGSSSTSADTNSNLILNLFAVRWAQQRWQSACGKLCNRDLAVN